MTKKTFYLFLAFICCIASVQAQNSDYIFKNFDTQEGLCDNHINAILEDSRGMIWIATREGLSRFDGAQFKNFYASRKKLHSLQSNYVSHLSSYSSSEILLLNNNKAMLLNCYNNQFTTVAKLQQYAITGIEKLNAKVYAFTTLDKVFLMDTHFNILQSVHCASLKAPLQIKWLEGDRYLVCDMYSFCIFNLKKLTYTPIVFSFQNHSLGQDYYYNIQQIDQKRHQIYISDYWTGLYVFDFNGKLLKHYTTNDLKNKISCNTILSSKITQDAKLWLTTDNGVNVIDLITGQVQQIYHNPNRRFSVISNVGYTLAETKNKDIWIGTDEGLSFYKNQLSLAVKKTELPTPKGYNLTIADIAFENNLVFAGCYLSDTYAINTTTSKINKLKETPSAWNVKNYDGSIMITGGGQSITKYNPKTNNYKKLDFLKPYFPNSDIVVMSFRHSNGDYWYSGNVGGGFVRVHVKTNQIEHYPFKVNGKQQFYCSYYSSVAEDAAGDLWFGVNKASALLHWIKRTNTFEEIPFSAFVKDAISNPGGINQLVCNQNHLWIAYDGNGLGYYNTKTKMCKLYTTENGLPSNFIRAIEMDTKARLWMITPKGISYYIPKDNKIVPLNIWDGFTDNPNNYSMLKLNDATNTMWLGATNCLYQFQPDEIIKNKTSHGTIYLDEVKINNTAYSQNNTSAIQLPPDENTLQFALVAVSIENGKNMEYSYKLKGFNDEWVTLGTNREVLFPKLKSGYYQFMARAREQGSQDWFYLQTPFAFTITNYWYNTWWFMTLCILVVLFAIWSIFYFNFKKKLEKQKAVEEERNRIAADMHDDLGSGLTKITYLSQIALHKANPTDYLSTIKTTSTQLVENMSEIIWTMKEENNNWEELVLFIKNYTQEYCENNNLEAHFILPESELNTTLIGEVRRHIFLAIKECLHNIVKHAKAKNVILKIEKNSAIIITIQDDGIGFTETSESHVGGNGLPNISKRIKKINGTMKLSSSAGGTVITLCIPY